MSITCFAQTRKTGIAQKKSTVSQKKTSTSQAVINDGAELSLSGHIDFLKMGDEDFLQIDKNAKANYIFKVFSDPSDNSRPQRKTVILTCDIDWKKAFGVDENVPCEWSWSSRNITVLEQKSGGTIGYGVADGNTNVAAVIPNMKKNGKTYNFVVLNGGGNQLTGLRQGMHIDDVARHIQAEIPGTRVVITGKKRNGLTEYVLLSFGEKKVYDVTGDYHYQLTNDEPYFTFWTDSKDKLVKWFALKRIR